MQYKLINLLVTVTVLSIVFASVTDPPMAVLGALLVSIARELILFGHDIKQAS